MKKFEKFFAPIAKFFKELKSELKKVIWPTRKQLVNNTTIVLIAILLIGSAIWILDAVFAATFNAIIPETSSTEIQQNIDVE